MISIIISSFKEPTTIGKAIRSVADPTWSGYTGSLEIIQVSPDQETLRAGMKAAKELNLGSKFIQIKDPQKGKPYALNIAFKEASADILILTDGDVHFEKNAVKHLVDKINSNKNIGGVSGRPVASWPTRDQKWGYICGLLADVAHHKRATCSRSKQFFPMSGYIMAIKKPDFTLPTNVLSDDAYISYMIAKSDQLIDYAPYAIANIRYPDNATDYYKQKVRSLGGYTQLEKMGVTKIAGNSRSFFEELKLFWFPLGYAKSAKELYWSIMLFPIRLITWIKIFHNQKVKKESFEKTWVRVESTK